jgi:hypothetical protein
MCGTWTGHSNAEIDNGIGVDIDEMMASQQTGMTTPQLEVINVTTKWIRNWLWPTVNYKKDD